MSDPPTGKRKAAPDRARKRAVRDYAAQADVPYSVAARQLATPPASADRTIYPPGGDAHRAWLIECRGRRTAEQRVADTRLSADLPFGRAQHLVERFPPSRGMRGTGVGQLYHGTGRVETLALLYHVVALESPQVLPNAGELAWTAEMGEETAMDTVCAVLDRAARLLLDDDDMSLRTRIRAALDAGAAHHQVQVRNDSARLDAVFRAADTVVDQEGVWESRMGLPLTGVSHILDAVLVVNEDGHAPGTRVLLDGRRATIVSAVWATSGPPRRYVVAVDASLRTTVHQPGELTVLPGQAPC
ncbi:hypothetical protein [Micromonospora ureilytica]|uniref:Uncharacterized protein n=1 Tax=Micromonospora ureilytica TaxID=709868 RepID=A0ABS0JBR4_9ACTN|nr:hypothetical protein [Micromonospora ureilytica]MBG6064439.1 hypothetical protein [Micromonospora ureilytica]